MGRSKHSVNKIRDRTQVNRLALLFACSYMISYITRINFGAIISEVASDTGIGKTLLSMSLTGSFITYGVGQIISGVMGDRISPKKLVSLGLIATVSMNLLIPICADHYQMCLVWCVNGFAQSFMWPPLVRMMAALLSEEDYKRTTTKVSWGSSCGTIVVYLVSPLVISAWGWRSVFVFSAGCGIVMLVLWHKFAYDITTEKRVKGSGDSRTVRPLFSPLMLAAMLVIMLQGMLRDGITTWMPTYIADTYSLSNIVSILTGVILPVFSIFCVYFATQLYLKKLTNPLSCAGTFFAAGSVAALALYFLTGKSTGGSVLVSAILTGCMHGVNHTLISMIPPFFKKYGSVSTVSGVINSCTYIGSAISTYGFAALSETVGWQDTVFVWFLIASLGSIICLMIAKAWKRKFA